MNWYIIETLYDSRVQCPKLQCFDKGEMRHNQTLWMKHCGARDTPAYRSYYIYIDRSKSDIIVISITF